MKLGILNNLSWAAFLFLLLTTLSALLPLRHIKSGIYYYDQNGKVIWFETGDISKSYVVRTTKTLEDIYGDLNKLNPKLKDGSHYETAPLQRISIAVYDSVIQLIGNGDINNQLVKDNIVEIESMAVLRNVINKIPDDGSGGNYPNNNREYGGMIQPDNSLAFFEKGAFGNPCLRGLSIKMRGDGKAEYHSHPSGTRFDIRFEEIYTCGFMQAPSKHDLQVAQHRRGYVFGMGNELIYMYDSSGIKAIFPFPASKKGSSR